MTLLRLLASIVAAGSSLYAVLALWGFLAHADPFAGSLAIAAGTVGALAAGSARAPDGRRPGDSTDSKRGP